MKQRPKLNPSNGGGAAVPTKTSKAVPAVGNEIDYEADARKGLEHTDRSSFAIPFLIILQGLSPQLDTIEGARPGRFLNTVTNELFKDVLLIPCGFQRRYVRWAPRHLGGGYKGEVDPMDVQHGKVAGLVQHEQRLFVDVPKGESPFDAQGVAQYDTLKDTRNHFVLVRTKTGAWAQALLTLTSSQVKKSKRWMSLVDGLSMTKKGGGTYTPAMYSHTYRLTSVKEENAKGSWFGMDFEVDALITDASLYATAQRFHETVTTGGVEVPTPVSETERETDGF